MYEMKHSMLHLVCNIGLKVPRKWLMSTSQIFPQLHKGVSNQQKVECNFVGLTVVGKLPMCYGTCWVIIMWESPQHDQ